MHSVHSAICCSSSHLSRFGLNLSLSNCTRQTAAWSHHTIEHAAVAPVGTYVHLLMHCAQLQVANYGVAHCAIGIAAALATATALLSLSALPMPNTTMLYTAAA